ncbi:hypothetical protein BCU90_17400 [Vibrio lentus]|uniref:hypothetical protein n=1 Tax=Vibrio lentus TaxID=136468 RepID=UPI000C825EB2|nr:hypothetical protein [Vibrio lentus]PMG45640.1 hypothetical protein BCU90_17400 [Vibrio lentus]
MNTDSFNHPDLEITNPQEQLQTSVTTDTSLDDFAQMMHEESKSESDTSSFGLDEPTFDENGHEVEFEGIEDKYSGDSIENELNEHAEEVAQKQLEENLEQYQEFAQSFSELPDDLEFNVGGQTINKETLTTLVNTQEQIAQVHEVVNKQSAMNDQLSQSIELSFNASQTETSKQIQAVKHQLSDPYLSDMQKGQLFQELTNLQNKNQVLVQESQKAFQAVKQREQVQNQVKANLVSQQLQSKYSNEDIVGAVQHANSQGITNEDLQKSLSVPLMEALIKAKKHDDLMSKSKSNIQNKTTKSPKRNARKQAVKRTGSKEQALKKIQNGELDSDVFNALED